MCQHCRKLGNHSAGGSVRSFLLELPGEAKKHRLIGLREAYAHALKARRRTLRGLAVSQASSNTAHGLLSERQRVESQQAHRKGRVPGGP